MSVNQVVDELLNEEPNVGAVAVIKSDGSIIFQTENWDLSSDVQSVLNAPKGGTSINLLGIKYMIVENTPERIIGTNVTGKGHVIIAPFKGGFLVTYILPQVGPRDVLFNVQQSAQKLNGLV
ncbi:MAG: profilin family protein [Promethearchaeota archaeon]